MRELWSRHNAFASVSIAAWGSLFVSKKGIGRVMFQVRAVSGATAT